MILDTCNDLAAGNARVSMIHAASGATPPRLTCRMMRAVCADDDNNNARSHRRIRGGP